MLRMDFHELSDKVTMRMEGRLVGDFAEHARTLLAKSKVASGFLVDLSDVIFVDETGEEVLLWFKQFGVKFIADSAYSRDVCDRLQLPLVNGSANMANVGPAHSHRRSQADKTGGTSRECVPGVRRV